MSHLLFGGDRCFPRLKIRSSPYAIPSFRSNNDASVGFLFRLKKLFEIGASGKQAEIVDINFDDVEEQIVSEYDLKTTLNRTECRDLVSVVSSKPVGDRAPVVIGRLYTGKRRISLNYDDSATATARLSEFLSYTPAVNVTGAVGFGKIVSIADREPVALAFLPAFVPARTAGSVLGEGASNSQSSTFGWAPLDLAKTPSQRSALEELTTQVFQDWLLDAGR
ncbi:hypothetical protein [Methylocella silvestris]|nr:hypothetical protein [Methylocella silvestris]